MAVGGDTDTGMHSHARLLKCSIGRIGLQFVVHVVAVSIQVSEF